MANQAHIDLYLKGKDAWNANPPEFADFSGHTFKGEANFSKFIFNKVIFKRARFNFIVDFNGSKFYKGADFSDVLFDNDSYFIGSEFFGGLLFKGVIINGIVDFSKTNFHEYVSFNKSSSNNADYLSAIYFSDVKFYKQVYFNNSKLSFFKFNNSEFCGHTAFRNVTFKLAPEFHEAKFHQDTDFTGAEFPDYKSEGAVRAYRTLKLAMNKFHAHDEELMFLALEMKAKRHRNDCPKDAKLFSLLYDIFSDYGRSVSRPLLGILFMSLLLFSVSSLAIHGPNPQHSLFDKPCIDAEKVPGDQRDALNHLVFHNLMPLIPDVRKANENAAACLFNGGPEPLWWAFTSAFHAGFSLVMWFLVALGLRNLFRLK